MHSIQILINHKNYIQKAINYIRRIKNMKRRLNYLINHQLLIKETNHHYGLKFKVAWLIQGSNHLGGQSIISRSKTLQFIILKRYFQFNLSAESLRLLNEYKDAIIWADKALQIDPKDCSSLQVKGDSLRSLRMFPQAMQQIDQSLKINPNHFASLLAKGLVYKISINFKKLQVFIKKLQNQIQIINIRNLRWMNVLKLYIYLDEFQKLQKSLKSTKNKNIHQNYIQYFYTLIIIFV
ncbi:unnamed protein product [Paramecium pentaurelia]|uniref:Tetratricopeptide repeat protein n=1 Tax=Paramecium pentaurelia TaxID=43138 RepID=A0A8S1VQD8_9CILI|nr:unnamed protein product [Paramecium pentaurelia]